MSRAIWRYRNAMAATSLAQGLKRQKFPVWIVLWLVLPAGLLAQAIAFGLFRFFDAVKPGPVGWADALFHRVDVVRDPRAWQKAGLGIMLDDLVAAFCTLFVIAAWKTLW